MQRIMVYTVDEGQKIGRPAIKKKKKKKKKREEVMRFRLLAGGRGEIPCCSA